MRGRGSMLPGAHAGPAQLCRVRPIESTLTAASRSLLQLAGHPHSNSHLRRTARYRRRSKMWSKTNKNQNPRPRICCHDHDDRCTQGCPLRLVTAIRGSLLVSGYHGGEDLVAISTVFGCNYRTEWDRTILQIKLFEIFS